MAAAQSIRVPKLPSPSVKLGDDPELRTLPYITPASLHPLPAPVHFRMPVVEADLSDEDAITIQCDGDDQPSEVSKSPTNGDTLRKMPGHVTIPTRVIVYIGALLVALFGGGQLATVRLVSQDAQDVAAATEAAIPSQRAIAAQITDLASEVRALRQEQATQWRSHDEKMGAIIEYQLEADRFSRESAPHRRRPPELERALARIQRLAQR